MKKPDLIIDEENMSKTEILVRSGDNYPGDEDDKQVLWCNTSQNVNNANELTWLNSDVESGESGVNTECKNLKWLRLQVANSNDCAKNDVSNDVLTAAVFDIIKLHSDNEYHLEDELYVVLGFYRINLIRIVLKNYKELLDSVAMLDTQTQEKETHDSPGACGIWQRLATWPTSEVIRIGSW